MYTGVMIDIPSTNLYTSAALRLWVGGGRARRCQAFLDLRHHPNCIAVGDRRAAPMHKSLSNDRVYAPIIGELEEYARWLMHSPRLLRSLGLN